MNLTLQLQERGAKITKNPTGQSCGADRNVVGMTKSQSYLSGRHPDTITSQLESQVGSEKGEISLVTILMPL